MESNELRAHIMRKVVDLDAAKHLLLSAWKEGTPHALGGALEFLYSEVLDPLEEIWVRAKKEEG